MMNLTAMKNKIKWKQKLNTVTEKKSPEKTVEESKPNFRGCSPYKSSQYHDVGVTEGDMRPQQILAQIAQNIKSRTTNVPSTRDSPSASGQNQQHQKKPQQTESGIDARKNRRLGRQESRYTSGKEIPW